MRDIELKMPMRLQYFASNEETEENLQNTQEKDPEMNEEKSAEKLQKRLGSETARRKALEEELSKAQETLKSYKEKEEQDRQSKLSEQELLDEANKKVLKAQEELKLFKAEADVRTSLSEANLPIDFVPALLVSIDEEMQAENIDKFTKYMQSYRESIVNEIMKDKTPPKPKESQNDGKSWRDQIRENYKKVKESE
ncbi:DUF4355 domain-containing protein [Enterococcus gallinarum]|uniref:capsid assembly scaffolding protein Gp46 family protein n=1 Tax=Enterococcus gallinarum TaxID=1353 RepID=UPI003D6ADEE0